MSHPYIYIYIYIWGYIIFDRAPPQGRGAQTPPVPQKEYAANSGASGVMQMIEKLIGEAKQLEALVGRALVGSPGSSRAGP